MKRWKIIFLLMSFVCLSIFGFMSKLTWAQSEEEDLYLVAQKAFDDGFYDVAIRYLNEFLEKYPQTEKRNQANLLLGQCFFFRGQYLKAFDIFQGLMTAPDLKDATLFWLAETYLKGTDYPQAEKYYRQLIEDYPASLYVSQGYYSLGWLFFDQKNYESAKQTFAEFLKKFPASALAEDSLFKLGECDYNLHLYESAIEYFHDYVLKFPQSLRHDQVYFYMAEAYYYLEKLPEAIEYYTKTISISRDDRIILLSKISLGWSYLKQKDFDNAQQFFDQAKLLSKEKNMPLDDIDLGRASLFFEKNDYAQALAAYDELIKNFPNSQRIVEAHLGKANALYLLKNYPEAIGVYRDIITKFANDRNFTDILEKAYFGLGWAYLKGAHVEEAIQTFEEAASKTTNNITKLSALTQMADVYHDAGNLERALETYDKVLKDFPNSPYMDYIQYRQGITLLQMNKIEAATLSFQSLQANFPNSKYLADTKYYLGLANFKREDWAAAKDYLADFSREEQTAKEFQADAHYLLGVSLSNLQNYPEAIKVFQKVIKNYPDAQQLIGDSELSIAKCLYSLGDTKEAIKRLKIVVYKYPNTNTELEALLWLGDYYLAVSEFENAIRYYQQVIDRFPGSEKGSLAHYGLGQVYQKQGLFDSALGHYKLLEDSGDSELAAKAKLAIAEIFSKETNPDVAIDRYLKITLATPEFSRDAFLKIAQIYQSNRDYQNALSAYQQALRSPAGANSIPSAGIQFSIADLKEILNKPNEAVDEYLKIPYLYTQETGWAIKAYLRMARIFENQEDWENAKLIYNKIMVYGTDEIKFAQERLDWINHNTVSLQK